MKRMRLFGGLALLAAGIWASLWMGRTTSSQKTALPLPPDVESVPTERTIREPVVVPTGEAPATAGGVVVTQIARQTRGVLHVAKVVGNPAGRAMSPSTMSLSVSEAYAFLRSISPPQGYTETSLHAAKNDLMNQLLSVPNLPPGIIDYLADIYNDRRQDVVTRDYALQHLSNDGYAKASESGKRMIVDVVRQAVREHDSSIGGTALLGMRRLAVSSGAFDAAEVKTAVLDAAEDENASVLTRLTAIRLCGTLMIEESRTVVERLTTDKSSWLLSLAAAAARRDLDGNSPASKVAFANTMNHAPCLDCP